jgi:hypothetical protein
MTAIYQRRKGWDRIPLSYNIHCSQKAKVV